MRNTILLISSILCALCLSIATTAQEKDPFFPPGERSVVTGSIPDQERWGRDPFDRPFETKTAAPSKDGNKRGLTGIIYGKKVHIAIIGGEAYKEGSFVDGRQLIQIRKRSVVLRSSSGSVEEMFLQEFSVRK